MIERVVKKTFRKGDIVRPNDFSIFPRGEDPDSIVFGIIEKHNRLFYMVRWFSANGACYQGQAVPHEPYELYHLDPGMLTDDEWKELAKNVL